MGRKPSQDVSKLVHLCSALSWLWQPTDQLALDLMQSVAVAPKEGRDHTGSGSARDT